MRASKEQEILKVVSKLIAEAAAREPGRKEIYEMRFASGIRVQCNVTIYSHLSDARLFVFPKQRIGEIPKVEMAQWQNECNEHLKSIVPFQLEGGVTITNESRSVVLSHQLARQAGLR